MRRLISGLGHPLAVSGVLALPLIVALVSARSPTWFPTGDLAQAELHMRAVPAHMPLLGAAGRFGTIFDQGSHLGPAGAVALSIPYRLLGSSSWSVMGATVTLHVAALASSLVMAKRLAGVGAMWTLAVVCAVMIRSFGNDWFLEPWNPWLGVVVLMAACLAAWGVWTGDDSLLPVFVVAGSFCAQVHIAYAPVVLGIAVALCLRRALAGRRIARPRRRIVIGSAIAAVVMWLPPLIDQITREPGNLTVLWRHFQDPPDAPAGWQATLSTIVNEMNLFGSWSVGVNTQPSAPPDLLRWLGFIGLIALAAIGVVATRKREVPRSTAAWHVLAVVVAVSTLTVTRIYGPVYEYLVRWLSAVTVLVVTISLWSILHAATQARPRMRRLAAAAGCSVAAALLIASAVQPVRQPLARDSHTLAALAPAVVEASEPGTSYLMRFHDPVSLGALGIGLLLDMERHGRSVGADTWLDANVLPHRTMDESEADEIVWVVTGEPAIERASTLPGARVIASVDPRTDDEAVRSDQLRRSIESQLTDAGRADLAARLDEQYGVSQVIAEPGLSSALVADLEAYRALRLPTAIVLAPVGTSL